MTQRFATLAALCALLAAPAFVAIGGPATAAAAEPFAEGAPQQSEPRQSETGRDEAETEAVGRFLQALREIRGRYVESLSDRELTDIAIQAMAGRDRYSTYVGQAEFQRMQEQQNGAFTGLGIRYEPQGSRVRIVETLPGSPAERARLRAGDVILAVDRQAVDGRQMEKVRQLLSGGPGTAVTLTIARDGIPVSFVVPVTREEMKVPSVKQAPMGAVGYIRILRFDRQTRSSVSAAIVSLREQIGPGLSGYVLDLRDNPGGLVNASVRVADSFLEKGTILISKGRDIAANRTYTAHAGDETGGLPLVVLVNGGSASAAEILTAALKDHRRAIVVGTRTFGKGVIQSIIPVEGGSALKLTTARYLTPSGNAIHEVGILPDEIVTVAETGLAETGPDERGTAAFPPKAADDRQLARALSIVTTRPTHLQEVSIGAR